MGQEGWLLNKHKLVGKKLSGAGQGSWPGLHQCLTLQAVWCQHPSVPYPGYQAGGVTVNIVQVSLHGTDTL